MRLGVARGNQDDETADADDGRQHDRCASPAGGRSGGERVDDTAEAEHGEQAAEEIERQRTAEALDLGDVAEDPVRCRDQRDVEQKDVAPGAVVDQPAAAVRAERRTECGDPGPDADALGAVGRSEGAVEERQTARYDERAADPLDRPGSDQQLDGRRGGAGQGREEHDAEADDEDPAAAEVVGQRAGEQQQGRDREQVAGDDPLQLGDSGVQRRADRRDGDVDHVRVEEADHRREHGRGEQRRTGAAAQRRERLVRSGSGWTRAAVVGHVADPFAWGSDDPLGGARLAPVDVPGPWRPGRLPGSTATAPGRHSAC